MPRGLREGGERGAKEGLHFSPVSNFHLFQVFSHLMPVKFCEEDTEYAVAMTGVPLLAE